MKILVAQFYTNNVQYANHTVEINRKYCERQGYEYYVETDTQKIIGNLDGRSPTWYKPKLILDVLERFNPDYIFFLDIDAVVVDFEQRIESYIDENHDLLFTDDYSNHSKMNAGVFIVKNTEWVRSAMCKWWDVAETLTGNDVPNLVVQPGWDGVPGYFRRELWHDQSCLTYLYNNDAEFKEKTKIITHRWLNWREPFDKNFIFHAFAYGHLPLRRLNYVHGRLLNEEPPQTKGMSLYDLAMVYPSDKEIHHRYFTRVYESLFAPVRESAKLVVEIGVSEGFSIATWRDYFQNATIVGIDVDPYCNHISSSEEGRTSFILANSGDPNDLTTLQTKLKDVDILVDDGGHKMHEQQLALAYLFHTIRGGGMYILEDLHTSTEAKMPEKSIFGWGDPTKTTTLDMLRHFQKTGKIVSDYLTEEQCRYLEESIESVVIYDELGDDSSVTSVIRKKVVPVVQETLLTRFTKTLKNIFTRNV